MGPGAAVGDREAPHRVLRSPDRRVGDRPVRLGELRGRYLGQPRPVPDGGLEVEALMEVEPGPQATLIDVEVGPDPLEEEPDHPRMAVRELQPAVSLGAFTRVQSEAGDPEVP